MNKKKKLYTQHNIIDLMHDNLNFIEVTDDMILTPSALDILAENNIVLRYKNNNLHQENHLDVEDIIRRVVKILKDKHNIINDSLIKKVVLEVLKELKIDKK